MKRSIVAWTVLAALTALVGCQSPARKKPTAAETARSRNDEHLRRFGDFELPRTIGHIENVGLQIPTVSPDGRRILYLRTDGADLSPLTLLGSPKGRDTPAEGTLSIWLRPIEGRAFGQRVSQRRWAHSPVWAESGNAIAYVVNDPPVSFIVHVDLVRNEETVLGLPDAINCLPRFADNDQSVIFAAAKKWGQAFRVYRQDTHQRRPGALTPEGMDCVLPMPTDRADRVFCARRDPDQLAWALCGPQGVTTIGASIGSSSLQTVLQTWAGVPSPSSPGGRGILFYDTVQDRMSVLHLSEKRVLRHRTGSIAACWLADDAIALATSEALFAVNTETGLSPQLLNGSWLPVRYVPETRRLILFGKDRPGRFAIVEITFRTRPIRTSPHAK